MTRTTSYKLSKTAQRNVVSFWQNRYQSFGISAIRDRLERIDKAIQLESEIRREREEHWYNDIEMDTIGGPCRTISNFLIDLYVNSPEIFEAVTGRRDNQELVKMVNAINEENAKSSNWVRELILVLRDVPRYPYGVMEVAWEVEEQTAIKTDVTQGDPTTGAFVTNVQRAGNVLRRWDPYNTVFDTNVDINEIHTKGEFIGTTRRRTMIDLHTHIANLKAAGNHTMNDDCVWTRGGTAYQYYYQPQVAPELQADKNSNGWLGFFGVTPDNQKVSKNANFYYEHTTFYARIIPSMFGIKVPGANKMQIWRFEIVGTDTVIFAEKVTAAHSFFPAIAVQIDEQGIKDQVKTTAEKLLPVHNLSNKLYDARINGLKRGISDRGFYDSARISKHHIEDDSPSSKVPVKPDIMNRDIRTAYFSQPFNDNLGPTFLNEVNFLRQASNNISGLNNPQQGQLQKGNRTLGEFTTIMQNADDDLRTWGKLVEAQLMQPIKHIIKINIMQYQGAGTITAPDGTPQQIDPVAIRQGALSFKLADGLVTKDTLLDTQTAQAFMQLVLQVPMLQQAYGASIPDLLERIMGGINFDISDLRVEPGAQGNEQ